MELKSVLKKYGLEKITVPEFKHFCEHEFRNKIKTMYRLRGNMSKPNIFSVSYGEHPAGQYSVVHYGHNNTLSLGKNSELNISYDSIESIVIFRSAYGWIDFNIKIKDGIDLSLILIPDDVEKVKAYWK